MEKRSISKFRWFWAWDDEKEEEWLRSMSLQGWHLQALGFPGFYRFAQGEPGDYCYSLDFRTGSSRSLEEYRQICRDSGWQELGRRGSWHYFRKQRRDGEQPEFFSDKDSKVQKYRRLILFLIILLPFVINGLRLLLRRQPTAPFAVLVALYVLVLLGMAVAIIKLLGRISRLKRG